MSNIALTINLTGPTWAWYVLGGCIALAATSLAVKWAADAWSTWRQINNIPR